MIEEATEEAEITEMIVATVIVITARKKIARAEVEVEAMTRRRDIEGEVVNQEVTDCLGKYSTINYLLLYP